MICTRTSFECPVLILNSPSEIKKFQKKHTITFIFPCRTEPVSDSNIFLSFFFYLCRNHDSEQLIRFAQKNGSFLKFDVIKTVGHLFRLRLLRLLFASVIQINVPAILNHDRCNFFYRYRHHRRCCGRGVGRCCTAYRIGKQPFLTRTNKSHG